MCLTPAMRRDLQRARRQALTLIHTLSRVSEASACDDLLRCEDGYIGSHAGRPARFPDGFVAPEEASPLTMAARLHSWLRELEERVDEQAAAQN